MDRNILRGTFGPPVTAREVTAAPLTTKQRHSLPQHDFAIPETHAYPIDTPERARSALARVKAHGTPEEQRRVRDAVKNKYPAMNVQMAAAPPPPPPKQSGGSPRDSLTPAQQSHYDKFIKRGMSPKQAAAFAKNVK